MMCAATKKISRGLSAARYRSHERAYHEPDARMSGRRPALEPAPPARHTQTIALASTRCLGAVALRLAQDVLCSRLHFRNGVASDALRPLYDFVSSALQLQPTVDDLLACLRP